MFAFNDENSNDDVNGIKTAYSDAVNYFVCLKRTADPQHSYGIKAIEKMDEAISGLEKQASTSETKMTLSYYYYQKGEIYFFRENNEYALVAFQRAIELFVKAKSDNHEEQKLYSLAKLHYKCGETYLKLEEWRQAEDRFKEVISLLEQMNFKAEAVVNLHVRALCYICKQYVADQKWKKSLTCAKEIITLVPLLGSSYVEKKEYLTLAYENLSLAYNAKNQKKVALACILEAINLELDSTDPWEEIPPYMYPLYTHLKSFCFKDSLAYKICKKMIDLSNQYINSTLSEFYDLHFWLTQKQFQESLFPHQLLVMYMKAIVKVAAMQKPPLTSLIQSLRKSDKKLTLFKQQLAQLEETMPSLRTYTEYHPSVSIALVLKQNQLEAENTALKKQVTELESRLAQLELRLAQPTPSMKYADRGLFGLKFKIPNQLSQSFAAPSFGHKRSYSE